VFRCHNNKPVRQQVVTGLRNDNEIVIRQGVEEGDLVYLTIPENPDELPLHTL
jgi:hypothetical protein